MPIIKSAKKRVRVAAKATIRNAKTKRQLREAIKSLKLALSKGKPEAISAAQNKAVSAIDTAVKKHIMHPNKAARKKSQLAKEVKAAGVKPKTVAKKPVAKAAKPVAAKPSTKKVASKKVSVKPAAKKATKKPAKTTKS